MDQNEKYEAAKSRVAEIRGFYTHLIVFAFVLPVLGLIDLYDDKSWWVHWVLLGWGAGVIFHWARTFSSFKRSGKSRIKDWEEKKIREIMDEGE